MGKDNQILKKKYEKVLVLNGNLKKMNQKDGSANDNIDQIHGERAEKRKDNPEDDVETKKRKIEQKPQLLADKTKTIDESSSKDNYIGTFQPRTPIF
uniref:Uncharacterized protein n=1 Tax=Panagrolaimus sp. JU765 TaxID=591449 RepID=A0AC34Q0X6_9BILA